ncbi:FecR family protein [Advenella mimigardefordensis]|uniref:Putative transmembrane sensor FecR n=1 Tax=Advenella mimigardefordensis (strain DSM 17166 / LMG 22922 / DPN7) TaxID=1247726 RepID=W0PCY7_ADVMD|nr:FecR family protein [Advenella mimigardefordensis]AHG64636.1 putative transmembrane sensor FecR [Advenella mimigardefordensis DPN7]
MTDPLHIPPDDPREAAAWWFTLVRAGKCSQEQLAALQLWRQANPAHDREYRAMEQLWQWADHVPARQMRALAAEPHDTQRRFFASRRGFVAAGLAACTAMTVGAGLVFYNDWQDGKKIQLETARGERRTEYLPDGTRLDLNTASSLTFRVSNGKRLVELLHGDVMFDVAHDPAHPFYVITAVGCIKVVGTRFNVRMEQPLDVLVAVESGVVSVRAEATPVARSVKLMPSMSTHITASGVSTPQNEDVAVLTAWRQGKVIFRNRPLASVVSEMNRYLPEPMVVADPRLERLPVAGVFNVDDLPAFLDALPQSLPLRVVRSDRGGIRLFMR